MLIEFHNIMITKLFFVPKITLNTLIKFHYIAPIILHSIMLKITII